MSYEIWNDFTGNFKNPLRRFWKHDYMKPGLYPGFKNIGELYTVKLGYTSTWFGYPHSGKTEMLMEIALYLAEFHGVKHLVRAPDSGKEEAVLNDIIYRYLRGKTPDEASYEQAVDWCSEYFKIVTIGVGKDGLRSDKNMVEFTEFLCRGDHDCKIGIMDSANHFQSDLEGARDLYLRKQLKGRNDLVERYGVHLHSIVHIAGDIKPVLLQDGSQKWPKPHYLQLSGGKEWANYAHSMPWVSRPDYGSNLSIFGNAKSKPKGTGRVGECELKLCMETNRYYEFREFEQRGGEWQWFAMPPDKRKENDSKTTHEPTQITPNESFDDEGWN